MFMRDARSGFALSLKQYISFDFITPPYLTVGRRLGIHICSYITKQKYIKTNSDIDTHQKMTL